MSGVVAPSPATVAVDPRTDSRWHALAAGAQGSVFTSPPWIRAVCDTYGFSPQARIVTDEIGRATNGFAWVPISDLHGDRTVSMPFSDRAEPVVADPSAWSTLVQDALLVDAPLRIRCLDDAAPVADARFERVGEAAWQGTPLGVTTWELHDKISTRGRRDIATAQRRGVRVDALDGIDAVRLYHRLHVSLRKYKHRQLAQPLELFERIWQEFNGNDGIVTLVASVDDEPIAAAIYLVWNDVLYYKFGASLAAGLSACPNDALAWAALCWATERGLRLVDWGLSDLGQPGLIAFKHKWASEERRIVTVRSEHQSFELAREPGRVLGELTRLLTQDAVPDNITELGGSLLYRYFA